MIVKKIDVDTTVTNEQLTQIKSRAIRNRLGYTALDLGMELPVVCINVGEEDTLFLVNPKISPIDSQPLVYFEKDDSKKNRVRRVIRYNRINVQTSNMGVVEFGSERDEWGDIDEFMNDEQLLISTYVQRLVDSINGISNKNSVRRYNPQIREEKIPRNKRVMLQSSEGETVFTKYKYSHKYFEMGYQLV